jgi:hypothetical protein
MEIAGNDFRCLDTLGNRLSETFNRPIPIRMQGYQLFNNMVDTRPVDDLGLIGGRQQTVRDLKGGRRQNGRDLMGGRTRNGRDLMGGRE